MGERLHNPVRSQGLWEIGDDSVCSSGRSCLSVTCTLHRLHACVISLLECYTFIAFLIPS